MGRWSFSRVSQRAIAEWIALFLALIIGLTLVIAAWGKFFYPSEHVKTLDQCISGFEVIFLVTVVLLRKKWQLWAASSVVFAGWFGYALYGYFVKLPCSCMGAMLNIPTTFSISLDLIFFTLSLIVAYLLGARLKWIYFSFLAGLMAGLIGYSCADCIYSSLVKT